MKTTMYLLVLTLFSLSYCVCPTGPGPASTCAGTTRAP